MNNKKTLIISASLALVLAIVGGGVWLQQKDIASNEVTERPDQSEEKEKGSEISEGSQEGGNIAQNDPNTPTTLEEFIANLEDLPIPDVDTSDWQTYRNDDMGIEFKYPKEGWYVRFDTVSENVTYLSLCEDRISEISGYPVECTLSINIRNEEESKWVKDFISRKKHFPTDKLARIIRPNFSAVVDDTGNGDFWKGSIFITLKFPNREDLFLVAPWYFPSDTSYQQALTVSHGVLLTLKSTK